MENAAALHDRLNTYIQPASYGEPDDQYDTLAPNTDDMRAQLEFVFGGVPDDYRGLIEIAHTNARGDVNQAQLFRTDQIEEAVEFAAAKNRERLNVYFGAALRKPDTPPFGRAKATDVLCATCGWVDCDDQGAAKQAKENWGRLPPSLFGITGTKDDSGKKEHYRAHFYYRYDAPLVDHEQIRSVQKMLVAKFGGDKSVHNPDRVMRLMGSIAWPTPKKPNRVPEMTRIKALNKPGRPTYAVEELVRGFAPTPVADLLATTAPTTPAQEPTTAVAPPAQEQTVPASPSSSGGLGLIPPLLTEGRERAMLATSVKVSKQVIYERRAFPTTAEVCAVALPQHLRKYAEHVPGKVSRGEAEMMQKCASAILKFKNGGFEGAETLEKIIASYELDQREAGKLPATNPDPAKLVERFKIETVIELRALPLPHWLVKGWIPAGTVGILYGLWGAGKSLIAFDLALSMAHGLPDWHGAALPEGGGDVLYIAREGHSGYIGRIDAWKKHHNITEDTPRLHFMRSSVSLNREDDFEGLCERIRATGIRYRLIILDTVARVLPGVEINKPETITLFMDRCAALSEIAGATVLGVHHENKNGTMMGSIYFENNSDFMFHVTRAEGGELTRGEIRCDKQKDGSDGWTRSLAFKKIPLTLIGDKSSLVVDEIGEGSVNAPGAGPSRDVCRRMLVAIQEHWDGGRPLSNNAQAKAHGKHAPEVLARMLRAERVTERQVKDLVGMWLTNNILAFETANANTGMKGLRVIGSIDGVIDG